MSRYIKNFLKFKHLLNELISRDIKTKYRRSILGVLWTLLNPLFTMIILSIVFSNLFKFDIENFPVYILSGQVIFNFYSESTSNAMNSIIRNAALIKKVYIPKYLFVLSGTLSCAINVLASFSALMFVLVFTRAELHYTMLLAFIPIILVVLFSLGVGLILAALTVKFRDIAHLYSVFITGLTYLTPLIYPMSILPNKMRIIVMMNPLTNILIMFRNIMMENTLPTFQQLSVGIIETAFVLVLGLYVFYKNQDSFILNV